MGYRWLWDLLVSRNAEWCMTFSVYRLLYNDLLPIRPESNCGWGCPEAGLGLGTGEAPVVMPVLVGLAEAGLVLGLELRQKLIAGQ